MAVTIVHGATDARGTALSDLLKQLLGIRSDAPVLPRPVSARGVSNRAERNGLRASAFRAVSGSSTRGIARRITRLLLFQKVAHLIARQH